MKRRQFLASPSLLTLPLPQEAPKFQLGTVTYNVGAQMDLPTLLATCKAAGFGWVELRTTHAHKVEPSLGADARQETRKRIEGSGVKLWGFGSVCEFHSPDPAVVKKHIDDCRAFCELARDLGAKGVKVRPNGLPKGIEVPKTLDQIGTALKECGKIAQDCGVEIWVEVHGAGTAQPAHMRTLMDACAHPAVGVCWNSNGEDVKNGSIREAFELLQKDIKSCHINELWSPYPWRELFQCLKSIRYDRVTLMEVAGVPEAAPGAKPDAALRFMRYYRALWNELTRA